MYSGPAQCSALARPSVESGWVTVRRSAIEGDDEVMYAPADLRQVEVEVLQDGVPVRAGRRGVRDDGAELLLGEAQVARQPGNTVAVQAVVQGADVGVVAQEGGEEGADGDLLPVVAV